MMNDYPITEYQDKDITQYIRENEKKLHNQHQAANWLIAKFVGLERHDAMRKYMAYRDSKHSSMEYGQSLVEFALFVILGFVALLLAFDAFLFAANIGLAQVASFNMSREASVFYAGDGSTCAGIAETAQGVTEPIGPASWQYSISPCPNDSTWVAPTGALATAIVTVTYRPMFAPGEWLFEARTQNIFQ